MDYAYIIPFQTNLKTAAVRAHRASEARDDLAVQSITDVYIDENEVGSSGFEPETSSVSGRRHNR